MGCSTSKNAEKILEGNSPRERQIDAKFAPMLDPSHQFNVNNKYTHLIKWVPNEFAGTGYRKTNKFVSLVSRENLEKSRNEFWGLLKRVQD